MEFKAEPYTLRLSPNSPETEKDFRENLNLLWCNSALFNVEAIDNRATIVLLDELKNYLLVNIEKDNPVYKNGEKKIEFESTLEELTLADKLLKEYKRKENPVEVADVLKDLEKLKKKIDEMNR